MSTAALPNIVIVGRPNVGKSTLFNRIVGRRMAVIEDMPGVTRDRLYAEADWRGYQFQMVDTGGILFSDDDPLVEQIRIQADIALNSADIVVFMVDAADGLVSGDMDLANRLRGIKVPVIVVANKADNPQRKSYSNEFFALGFEDLLPISSLHGDGVAEVLDKIVEQIPKVEIDEGKPDETRIAIVGRPNVGKSSTVNAYTGEERSIVSEIPGTTRDAIDTLIEVKGQRYRLIDTAGIRRKGKIQGTVEYYMVMRAQQAIERADCTLLIIAGNEGITDQDKRVAKMSHDSGKALAIVVNKWDIVEPPDGQPKHMTAIKKDLIKIIRNETPELAYASIGFASAKEEAGLEPVLTQVNHAVESWSTRIPTGQINRIVQEAVFRRPFSRKGKNLKVLYVTQASTQPPTFVFFCNDAELMHFSYQRYLENQIREKYPLIGTPIRIIVRSRTEKD